MLTMITWILLVSLFCKSTQDGNGKENGVWHCGPQNMTLTTPDKKEVLLTWEDDPACLAVHDVLMYELVVLIADKQVHYDEVVVTPDQIGSTHSWNWTPHLALECASHSVRLSSRYKNHTSPWKQEQTGIEIENPEEPQVFPKSKVFQVGSRATFCCVLPAGEIFDKMYINQYSRSKMNTTKISNQTYALTVDLDQASNAYGTDIKCHTQTDDNGATAYIGYPPCDRDLHCETRDLQSVECLWTVGNTHLPIKSATVYQLLGSPCADGSKGRCSQKVQVSVGERNWTLTAQNQLGTVELTHRADLTKQVHMFSPKGVTASAVNARNVSLEWGWMVQQYSNLNITCQVNFRGGEINTTSENFGVGLNFTVLDNLIPECTYTVMVRCGTTPHFWKWSEWSSSIEFHTKGDVPDALDLWMQMTDNQIIIIWKMLLANQSHGHIIDYEVTWAHTKTPERKNRTKVAHPKDSLALGLDTMEEYIISITARNINGSSSPSTITIPSHPANRVNTSRILGSDGGFNLSWSASPTASCGYIVDWCPTSGICRMEWLKVPPNETNASIFSKNLKGGLRYLLSIYACTQEAPVLLERREGYVREQRIQGSLFKALKLKQQDSDVEISWDPISLREQTAFIDGYILYCLDNNNNNSIVTNVSTEDPEATSLTARNLKISTYKFILTAQTAFGECGAPPLTATLNSKTDHLIKLIFISLVTVFGLLSLTTTLCYRHWTCIRHKVYPPIPEPVLTDKWLTSPGERSCRLLHVDSGHHSEAQIMDVPELHCKSTVNVYAGQEKTPFVFTQTPKGYFNQPMKNSTPQTLNVPSSLCRNVFPNPSYDLIIQTGDQQSNSGPDFHKGEPLERCSNEYQPHSPINQPEENPESPLSCDSTYILLPHSPSK